MKDVNDLEIYACIVGYPDYLITSKGRILSLKGVVGYNVSENVFLKLLRVSAYRIMIEGSSLLFLNKLK